MIIKLGSKPVTTDQLRDVGFALIALATNVDRYHLQSAQAAAAPGDEVERNQADRAASRVIGSMRKARKMIADATE